MPDRMTTLDTDERGPTSIDSGILLLDVGGEALDEESSKTLLATFGGQAGATRLEELLTTDGMVALRALLERCQLDAQDPSRPAAAMPFVIGLRSGAQMRIVAVRVASPGLLVAFELEDPAHLLRTELGDRRRFERVAAEVSADLLDLDGLDVAAAADRVLGRVGAFVGADLGYLFRFSDRDDALHLSNEWESTEVPPETALSVRMRRVRRKDAPIFFETLAQGHAVCVDDVAGLSDQFAAERRAALALGVHSIVARPLRDGKRLLGVVGLGTRDGARAWSRDALRLLDHVASVFTHALARLTTQRDSARLMSRSEALVSATSDPIACLAPSGIPLLWNRAFEEAGALPVARAGAASIVATDAEEIASDVPGSGPLRMAPGRIVHDSQTLERLVATWTEMLEAVRHGANELTRELLWSRVDGERWFELRLVALRSDDGAVTEQLMVARDVSERRNAQAELRRKAEVDPLTGLANSYVLGDSISAVLRRPNSMATLIYIDLDRIKSVNDMLGHDVGDAVLAAAAQRLRGELDDGDLLARQSGDKFALLSTGAPTPEQAQALVERILQCFRAPFRAKGHEVFVAATAGLVQARAGELEVGEMQRRCDVALTRAKQRNRGHFEFYDSAMHVEMQRRATSEQRLRQAMRRRELVVLYQPEVDLEKLEIVGVEALLRWRHPDKGLVSAADFIMLAEETSLILEIGGWVLEQSLRQAVEWAKVAPDRKPLNVKVNLSPRQLNQRDLAQRVADLLRTTGAAPEWLTLELTETALVGDPETAHAVMGELHALGVGLAIDDFGTGYSSFSYLKRFPVDLVKVDRSFLVGFPDRVEDTTIVRTIVGLARALGLGVVAEGVERREQVDALTAIGCRRAQGFLFSPAVDPATIVAMMQDATLISAAVTDP